MFGFFEKKPTLKYEELLPTHRFSNFMTCVPDVMKTLISNLRGAKLRKTPFSFLETDYVICELLIFICAILETDFPAENDGLNPLKSEDNYRTLFVYDFKNDVRSLSLRVLSFYKPELSLTTLILLFNERIEEYKSMIQAKDYNLLDKTLFTHIIKCDILNEIGLDIERFSLPNMPLELAGEIELAGQNFIKNFALDIYAIVVNNLVLLAKMNFDNSSED